MAPDVRRRVRPVGAVAVMVSCVLVLCAGTADFGLAEVAARLEGAAAQMDGAVANINLGGR